MALNFSSLSSVFERPALRRWLRRGLWGVVVALLLFQVWSSRPMFDPRARHDDFRALLFWTPQMLDDSYYPDDLSTSYAQVYNTDGIEAVYWLTLHAGIPAAATSVILSWLFYLLLLGGAWRLARALDLEGRGLMAPLLLMLMLLINNLFLKSSMGGIPRNVAFPLQAWALAFLIERRPVRAALLVVAAAFFHPQSFLILGGGLMATLGVSALRDESAAARRRARITLSAVVAGVALLMLVLLQESAQRERAVGHAITREMVFSIPEFQEDGRCERDRPKGPLIDLTWETAGTYPFHRDGELKRRYVFSTALIHLSALTILGLGLVRRRPWVARAWPLLATVASALVLYGLAYLLLADLYMPNRFLRPVVVLASLSAVAAGLSAAVAPAVPTRRRIFLLVWGAVALVSVARLFSPENETGFKDRYRRLDGVVEYVRTTPLDTVLAAWPENDAENLQILGERSVYLTREQSHTFFFGSLETVRERSWINIAAMLPESEEDLRPLADAGVDLVLVNRRRLREMVHRREAPEYDAPYAVWIEERVERVTPEAIERFWEEAIARAAVYEDDNVALVDLETLLAAD